MYAGQLANKYAAKMSIEMAVEANRKKKKKTKKKKNSGNDEKKGGLAINQRPQV